jgi:hypothetical protein
MNFNINLKKSLAEQILLIAKKLHLSRNAIVSEALEEWIKKHHSFSPPEIDLESIQDLPDFKNIRKESLKKPPKDPIA